MEGDIKQLLHSKGRILVFDERPAVKAWVELSVVDDVNINHPANPIEVKTTSGITIYENIDLDAVATFNFCHPGNMSAIELLYRGVVTHTEFDGLTEVANEEVTIRFSENNEAHPIPGFNGAKTAVTVNSVKSSDGLTTYTLTDDYTVEVDSVTGITHIVHVSTGDMPLDASLLVDYDYTPLEGGILEPNDAGVQKPRHILIQTFPDPTDLTKYRFYNLPYCTVESELMHSCLEIGEDNVNPNILPVTLRYQKPDVNSTRARWRWIDTVNV